MCMCVSHACAPPNACRACPGLRPFLRTATAGPPVQLEHATNLACLAAALAQDLLEGGKGTVKVPLHDQPPARIIFLSSYFLIDLILLTKEDAAHHKQGGGDKGGRTADIYG